jgi:hypothetical protein
MTYAKYSRLRSQLLSPERSKKASSHEKDEAS